MLHNCLLFVPNVFNHIIKMPTYSVRKLTRSASGASPSKLKAKIQGYVS